MSFLVGPLSGALVAGGVYYGFSNMIHSRTERHRVDLHRLSNELITSTPLPSTAPAPASSRIVYQPFTSMLKHRWNAQVESLVKGARSWDENLGEWGRRWLYGGDAVAVKRDS
ncbi:hypothetical protein BXZ70DRAFT_638299 [Cristinia sonorae]|uniref:MICOS complex subunit MIC12 n=1 Tax=Cristinia sonorae TaxID=1940300 RepID=A0A8K0XKV3_9AGAR|nr:hypothetical protein BXZ70DRAFT_638299 [Cristinia sonorae]